MNINYFYYDSLLAPALGKETKAQRIATMSKTLMATNYNSNHSPGVNQVFNYANNEMQLSKTFRSYFNFY